MKNKGELRILGNLGRLNGSKLHRVKLPLEYINGKEIEINGEKVVIKVEFIKANEVLDVKLKEADIFYNNFDIGVQAWEIGVKLSQYGVKLIEDLDDVFYLNPENPMFSNFNAGNVKRHLALADTIIVTNERLKKRVERFTNVREGDDFLPIHISPNHLPNEGQWEYKPKEFHNGKVRFGIYGSISHLPDWKLLKGMIKILGNNKKFANQAKFVLAGCGNDVYWKEIKSWFKGLKCEVDYIPVAPADNYMSLLDHVDVVLAPLVDNEFSWNKSSLKIAECAMRDVFLVGSVPYAGKDLSYGIAIDPEDWQKWIWSLLENNTWYELGKQFGEKNRNAMNFQQRIDNLLQAIAYCYTSEYKELDNFKIWGITFDENQYTEFEPVFNQTKEKAWRFEYTPIMELSNKMDNNDIYYGVFSWKFPVKTGMSKRILEKVIRNQNDDVLGLAPSFFKHNYLSFSYLQHPGLKEILEKVCNKLQLTLPKEVDKVVYSNFFLAKGNVYKEYVNSVVIPALNYMENEIWEEVNKDAQYKSGLSREQLLKYTGLEYYNFVTFVLERMLSVWLYNHPEISFKQIG
jgi:hypothetical protein